MLSSHKKLDPKIRFIGGICSMREECVIHQVQQIISVIPIDIYIYIYIYVCVCVCVCVCKTAAAAGGGAFQRFPQTQIDIFMILDKLFIHVMTK